MVSRTSLSSSTTRMVPLSVMAGAGLLAFLDLTQQAHYVIRQEGLFQIGRSRVCDKGLDFGCERVAGDESQLVDHLWTLSLQSLVEAEAVEIWHPDVAQNDIVVMLQRHFESLPTIDSSIDPVALPNEDLAQCIENLRLVFDDQDREALTAASLQRRRLHVGRSVVQRQPDGEDRTSARPIRYRNRAGMRANDARTKREPDPGAFAGGLRREKRLENPFTDVQGHTWPVVGDLDLGHALLSLGTRRNANGPAWSDRHECLPRVVDQVGQHLMDLIGVGDNLRKPRVEIKFDPGAGGAELEGQKLDGGLNDAVERDGNALGLPLPRHGKKRAHDAGAALGGGLDPLGSADQGRILGHLLQQHHLSDHHRQGVVQLMGNAGQKRPEHGHLLILEQHLALTNDLLLNPLVLGDVADRADKPARPPFAIENEPAHEEPAHFVRRVQAAKLQAELPALISIARLEMMLQSIPVLRQEAIEQSRNR